MLPPALSCVRAAARAAFGENWWDCSKEEKAKRKAHAIQLIKSSPEGTMALSLSLQEDVYKRMVEGKLRLSDVFRDTTPVEDTVSHKRPLPVEDAVSRKRPVPNGHEWFGRLTDMSPHLPAIIATLFDESGEIDMPSCNTAAERVLSTCTGVDAKGFVVVEFGSYNMTRTLGKTIPPRNGVKHWTVRMGHNKNYTSRADFVWTFLHELSHVLCNSHGLQLTSTCPCRGRRGHRGHGHDDMWKRCCVVLGVPEMKRIHARDLPQRFLTLVQTATRCN